MNQKTQKKERYSQIQEYAECFLPQIAETICELLTEQSANLQKEQNKN